MNTQHTYTFMCAGRCMKNRRLFTGRTPASISQIYTYPSLQKFSDIYIYIYIYACVYMYIQIFTQYRHAITWSRLWSCHKTLASVSHHSCGSENACGPNNPETLCIAHRAYELLPCLTASFAALHSCSCARREPTMPRRTPCRAIAGSCKVNLFRRVLYLHVHLCTNACCPAACACLCIDIQGYSQYAW